MPQILARGQQGVHLLEITGIYGLTSKVTRADEGMGGGGGYPQNLWFIHRDAWYAQNLWFLRRDGGYPKIYSTHVRILRRWGYAQNL